MILFPIMMILFPNYDDDKDIIFRITQYLGKILLWFFKIYEMIMASINFKFVLAIGRGKSGERRVAEGEGKEMDR